MSLKKSSNKRTICEVLREIADFIPDGIEHRQEIVDKLVEAESMAKRMTFKLLDYSKDALNGFWDENPNYEEDLYKRMKDNNIKNDEQLRALKKLAESIPSMGGREIGADLRRYAKKIKKGRDIVEVGSWLGAGTAQVCLGLLEGKRRNTVHVFDIFHAHQSQIEKAGFVGVKIRGDTLPKVKGYLSPFGCDIVYHKGEFRKHKWTGNKIGLYIDDACKRENAFRAAMSTFKKHFIPGETIVVLMDYFFFQEKPDDPGLLFQKRYVESSKEFKFIKRIRGTDGCEAVFLYTGRRRKKIK